MIRLAVAIAAFAAVPAQAEIRSADYAEPTVRYDHGILGDAIEYGAIEIATTDGRLLFRLPETLVFEDTAPRLADLDGDGEAEVVVVESDLAKGSRLAVWDQTGRVAVTALLGTRHRWLAPVGAADLDGDGRIEIAYVETPHRGKVLKIVRLEGRRLVPVAELAGLTNHRIGDAFIQGGIADCGDGPLILTADAGWRMIMATRLHGGRLRSAPFAPYTGPESLARVMACQ